jgi:hypothetical protein
MALLSQAEFARHRKVSPAMVNKYLKTGKIPKSCWQNRRGKKLIDVEKADQALKDNLDALRNPRVDTPAAPMPETWFYRGNDRAIAEKIANQERAADAASEGEEPGPGGYIHPWPVWAAIYAGNLFTIDPASVTVEQVEKTHWRLSVDEVDGETGEPCPWTLDLLFDLKPDLVEG